MGRFVDLSGRRFGRLVVLRRADTSKNVKVVWKCLCDCGMETDVVSSNLIRGNTRSCGCLSKEIWLQAITKHGGYGTRLYHIWRSMLSRCEKPSNNRYNLYGGRGIKVCEEWGLFAPFREWAINNGYEDSLSIDRIDVNRDYSPSNCRWATTKTQANNTRANRYLDFDGKRFTIAQWSEITGIPYQTLMRRVAVYGWDTERALTTRVRGKAQFANASACDPALDNREVQTIVNSVTRYKR